MKPMPPPGSSSAWSDVHHQRHNHHERLHYDDRHRPPPKAADGVGPFEVERRVSAASGCEQRSGPASDPGAKSFTLERVIHGFARKAVTLAREASD